MSDQLSDRLWQTCIEGNSKVWFDPRLLNAVNPSFFDPEYWLQQDAVIGRSKGRYTTYFVQTQNCDDQPLAMVLRHYYRGGLISKINKKSFWFSGFDSTRAYRELSLLSAMREWGLPVPRPVAAKVTKVTPWFCQNDILIELIPNSQDLFQYLTKQSLSPELWRQVGKTIRQFHDKGVYHSDLNIHNIMKDDSNNIWLIDFDKCDIRALDTSWQQANLDRLKRSLHKELGLNLDFHFGLDNWQQLMDGYQQ